MSILISFTILALDGNENVQDTYTNKTLSLKSPTSSIDFKLPSMVDFANMVGTALGFSNFTLQKTPKQYVSLINTTSNIETYRQEYVFDDDDNMLSKTYREGELKLTINRGNYYDTPRPQYSIPQIDFSSIEQGVYKLEYFFFDSWDSLYYKVTGLIALTTNKYPLKKWTITDVVNRCFDTLEAQKLGEKPRFKFQGVSYDSQGERENSYASDSQAEYCDKILSPEFSFTKMHAREMLQQVGGFIHGEPRITNFELEKSNGKLDRINYTVAFDKYGSKEYSHIKNEEYFSTGAKTDIKNFCKKDKKFSKNPLTIIFLCFILCIQ